MTKRYDLNPHDGEVGMEESTHGEYVKWDDYYELLKTNYEQGRETWKSVVSTDVYKDLKFGKFRDILNLLADGEISVGKCAQSIVERAGGIEPRLPEPTLESDLSWKERYDDLKATTEKEINAVLDLVPDAVRVCEGGAEENLFASLAVSVAKSLRKVKHDV